MKTSEVKSLRRSESCDAGDLRAVILRIIRDNPWIDASTTEFYGRKGNVISFDAFLADCITMCRGTFQSSTLADSLGSVDGEYYECEVVSHGNTYHIATFTCFDDTKR